MNKEASYSGFILTIIGSAVLVIAATTLDPYRIDYTGIIAGAVLTAFGLSVAFAGGIQPRFEQSTGRAYSHRRRLLADAKVAVAPSRTRNLEATREAQKPSRRQPPLARQTKILSTKDEPEAAPVSLPEAMFDASSMASPTDNRAARPRPKPRNKHVGRRSRSR